MNERELSESEVERLLSMGDAGRRSVSPIEAAIDQIRANYRSDAPPVGTALAEFVDVGLVAGTIDGVAATQITDVPLQPLMADADHPSRRNSMRAALVTFAGSITGKIVLGGTLTFAAAGGAQAAGIVDLPGIPQEAPSSVVTVDIDDEQPADELSGIEVVDDDVADEAADEAEEAEYDEVGIEEHRATVVDLAITALAPADEGVEADDDSNDQADYDDDDEADHDDDDEADDDDHNKANHDDDDEADDDDHNKANHDDDDEADDDDDHNQANHDDDDEADDDDDHNQANHDDDDDDEADDDDHNQANHDDDDEADDDDDNQANHDDDEADDDDQANHDDDD